MGMLDFLRGNLKNNKVKPVVILVLDGFGIAPPSGGNAISLASTPHFDYYKKTYCYGELIASGESVGLPANEAGNSEVGHLTIGAGRVVYQSLPRINMAIEDNSFFDNPALLQAMDHVKKNKSKLHILGLTSSGSVHSSLNHFFALMDMAKKNSIDKICIHAITDGRDAPPNDGINIITRIERMYEEDPTVRFSTVMGRYYAMDRDGRWERTEKAYNALVSGIGNSFKSAAEAMQTAYAKGHSDEFVDPAIISANSAFTGTIDDNDAVIFFNFRIDRPRQLTMAFVIPEFESLKTVEFGYTPHEGPKGRGAKTAGPTFRRPKLLKNLFFTTMTEYQRNLPVSAIAFAPVDVRNSLPEVLGSKGLKHFHLAESEKERMVTFYFDGMSEQSFPGEESKIISSPDVPTYDKKPEMSVHKVVDEFVSQLRKDIYHLFFINFANPDMVGHSGNLKATIKAVEEVDKATGKLVDNTLEAGGMVFITADHGNAEEMLTFPSSTFFVTSSNGDLNTEHSNNPVPLYIIKSGLGPKILPKGTLADVAPTVLGIMGIEIPEEMTGKNLLEENEAGETRI